MTTARIFEQAEIEADLRPLARLFGILLAAMSLAPSCALITCSLAGDKLEQSE